MIALSRPYTPASGSPLTAGTIIVCSKRTVRSKTEHLILMRREIIAFYVYMQAFFHNIFYSYVIIFHFAMQKSHLSLTRAKTV